MIEILKTLKDTPLPSILVIGGIVFLLLSFVRKVGSNIELEPAKTWLVAIIGIILLCSGVALYLIPAMQTSLAITPAETPIIVEATTSHQSASTPVITTPASSDNLASCQSFQNGEARQVSANTFVVGDIIIDGVNQYDAGGTGESTVAFFETSASVTAPWGAGCYTGSNTFIEQVIQRELQYGCGSTCTSVRFVLVKSNGEQSVQYFKK